MVVVRVRSSFRLLVSCSTRLLCVNFSGATGLSWWGGQAGNLVNLDCISSYVDDTDAHFGGLLAFHKFIPSELEN